MGILVAPSINVPVDVFFFSVLDNTPFDQGDPDGPKLSLHLAKKNINPRMLRETRLLTQQSVPSGYGVYTAHLHHAPPGIAATQRTMSLLADRLPSSVWR
jgi:hypothetical protein